MCGIFAYLNYNRPVSRKFIMYCLINGLRRLEYRGYDSAGISVDGPQGAPEIYRMKGPVDELEKKIKELTLPEDDMIANHVAIAHTRWATHGEPCERNSHPQRSDPNNEFVVVHNGIIANYSKLKLMLINKGYKFESETDTEVIVKLAKYLFDQDPKISFRGLVSEVMALIEGTFALTFKSSHFPAELIACKRGSPLILGIKLPDGTSSPQQIKVSTLARKVSKSISFSPYDVQTPAEYFLASDITAIIEHTKAVVYLEDDDVLHFRDGEYRYYNFRDKVEGIRTLHTLEMELQQLDKGQFSHYMLKEIHEQQETILNTMRGRVDFEKHTVKLGGIGPFIEEIRSSRRLILIACGTSYHSAVATRPVLERLTRIPIQLELASDFLDRSPTIHRSDTCVFISQSGETADTLRALEYCKAKNALCVGVTNAVGSAISRITQCGIYLNCGPEIGVASTKAYTSQIIALLLIGLKLAEDTVSTEPLRHKIIDGLHELPQMVRKVLELSPYIKSIAEIVKDNKSLLVMGRGYQYATCLEAALKIKEISYVHCEGIMAGELKHGTLALVDETMPIIFIATQDSLYDKVKTSFSEVTTRQGIPIVVCSEGDDSIPDSYKKIVVPSTVDCIQPVINIIPLQLLSYHMAVLRGKNVDKPRNLAKSVTVE